MMADEIVYDNCLVFHHQSSQYSNIVPLFSKLIALGGCFTPQLPQSLFPVSIILCIIQWVR